VDNLEPFFIIFLWLRARLHPLLEWEEGRKRVACSRNDYVCFWYYDIYFNCDLKKLFYKSIFN
jgi:hypothetical protein